MFQAPGDGPLHHRDHGLPIHAVVRGRLFPRQLPRQPGDRVGQRLRVALPLVRPRQRFDPWAACHTTHARRRVAQDQRLIPNRQVAPFADRSSRMHASKAPGTVPACEHASLDPLDFRHQPARVLADLANPMAFQPQPFPDTSFQAHWCRPSCRTLHTRAKDSRIADAPSFQSLTSPITLFGEEPTIPASKLLLVSAVDKKSNSSSWVRNTFSRNRGNVPFWMTLLLNDDTFKLGLS